MTTRSPLARDEYDCVPENSGGDTPRKNGLRHLPRKVVGVLVSCVVFVGALLGLYWGGAFEPWLNEYSPLHQPVQQLLHRRMYSKLLRGLKSLMLFVRLRRMLNSPRRFCAMGRRLF